MVMTVVLHVLATLVTFTKEADPPRPQVLLERRGRILFGTANPTAVQLTQIIDPNGN